MLSVQWTTFPQFQKSEVNGANALPLYGWPKAKKGVTGTYALKLTKVMEKLYNKDMTIVEAAIAEAVAAK